MKSHGIASGKKVTSYPSFKDQLSTFYSYSEERVVIDGKRYFTTVFQRDLEHETFFIPFSFIIGKLITSRGPGTAFEFALCIVEQFIGSEKMKSLVDQMLLKL